LTATGVRFDNNTLARRRLVVKSFGMMGCSSRECGFGGDCDGVRNCLSDGSRRGEEVDFTVPRAGCFFPPSLDVIDGLGRGKD